AARRHGNRLRRLKLLLRVDGGARRLCPGRFKSEASRLGASIVAGCGEATLLRVMLLGPLGALVEAWRTILPFAVVGALAVSVHGGPRDFEWASFGGTRAACQLLEEARFQISLSQGAIVSSHAEAAKRLEGRLRRWQFKVHASVKNLGIDFGMRMLKKAGVRLVSVCRSGGLATALHGVPSAVLDKACTVNARAVRGEVGRRSRAVQFALGEGDSWRLDSAFAANGLPLAAWARAVNLGVWPAAAFAKVCEAGGPPSRGHVPGPSGAARLTLQRIGREAEAWDRWRIDQGRAMELRKAQPAHGQPPRGARLSPRADADRAAPPG
ncbi:unnamed protein product, partial [Prorocentrum cordatum]